MLVAGNRHWASVQIHSQDSSADDRPLLCRHTGEGRCPGQNWFPAFAGKTRREAELNRLDVSEHYHLVAKVGAGDPQF